MLISPGHLHTSLTSLLADPGAHTALIIYPQGQLVASAFLADDDDDDESGGEDVDGREEGEGEDQEQQQEEEEDEEGDEPYLANQERVRLLLGLAAQWAEDESDRVECELGRLLLAPLPLSPPESIPSNLAQHLAPKSQTSSLQTNARTLLLVLNGSNSTPWSVLSAKAEEFKKTWKA